MTELKAAAVDVATTAALAEGAEVVFVDNRPVSVEGEEDLTGHLEDVVEMATSRHRERA